MKFSLKLHQWPGAIFSSRSARSVAMVTHPVQLSISWRMPWNLFVVFCGSTLAKERCIFLVSPGRPSSPGRCYPSCRAVCSRTPLINMNVAASTLLTVSRPFSATPATFSHVPKSASMVPESANASEGLIVGGNDSGITHDGNEFACTRSEYIGKFIPYTRTRSDAGDVLAQIDYTAAAAAARFFTGDPKGSKWEFADCTVATVAFNSFFFTQPIYDGDLIVVEARVIHAGGSSIGVHAAVKRQFYDSPQPSIVGECFVSMVIISKSDLTQPVKGRVPALRLTLASDIEYHIQFMHIKESMIKGKKRGMDESGDGATVLEDQLNLAQNNAKPRKVRMADTLIVSDRLFGIEDVNINDAIFGGEILRCMEKASLHCGRTFARSPDLFTLGMLDMSFVSPMYLGDSARFSAQVVCVRNSTLLVNVRTETVRKGKTVLVTRAAFLLVCIDPIGKPMSIPVGIDLEHASQEEMETYRIAQFHMSEAKKRRCSLHHPVLHAPENNAVVGTAGI